MARRATVLGVQAPTSGLLHAPPELRPLRLSCARAATLEPELHALASQNVCICDTGSAIFADSAEPLGSIAGARGNGGMGSALAFRHFALARATE